MSGNNVVITLRVPEALKDELDVLALEENRSLNNLVNTILIKYLESIKKDGEVNGKNSIKNKRSTL